MQQTRQARPLPLTTTAGEFFFKRWHHGWLWTKFVNPEVIRIVTNGWMLSTTWLCNAADCYQQSVARAVCRLGTILYLNIYKSIICIFMFLRETFWQLWGFIALKLWLESIIVWSCYQAAIKPSREATNDKYKHVNFCILPKIWPTPLPIVSNWSKECTIKLLIIINYFTVH